MLLYQSGLISEVLTLQNGFTVSDNNPLTIYRKGDIGFLSGAVTRGTTPAAGTLISMVSNTFLRPSRRISISALDSGSGMATARFDLFPDGIMTFVTGNFPLSVNGVVLIFL